MKKTLYFIFALTLSLALASCEKFELDDHCPEENQGQQVNPQDLRVNDDSDSEESGKPNVKSDSEESDFEDDTVDYGNGSDDDTDTGNPDDDDVINDDSDDEDEGGRPKPNGNPAK